MTDLVVHNANEVITPTAADGGVATTENGAVAVKDGVVAAAGPTDEVTSEYPPENADTSVDAAGKTVLPGFVDPHTHAAFAGDRTDEFVAKLHGATYQEILAEGGGILSTVRATREATRDALTANLHEHFDVMLAHGTTTVEVKSGYGLDVETEVKLLEAIEAAAADHPIDVVPTFMGAHAVCEDATDADAYVDRVVEEQIPAVADRDLATFADVFCEAGVFDVDQSRRVLAAAREAGMEPKVHAEEFERIGGAELAADLGAVSADHLLQATDDDAAALAEADVTPVLLPGTAFALDADYADPELFAAAGVPVAIATDFNPNCHSQSMEFAIELACNGMRMPPGDAVAAATMHAADALALNDGTGTLRPGAPGDLVVADVPTHAHLAYNFGVSSTETVVKGGEVVVDG